MHWHLDPTQQRSWHRDDVPGEWGWMERKKKKKEPKKFDHRRTKEASEEGAGVLRLNQPPLARIRRHNSKNKQTR